MAIRSFKRKRSYSRAGGMRKKYKYSSKKYRPMTAGKGITVQYDRTTIYNKKSMPRGMKCRYRKFAKKVNSVIEKELASQTYLFNETLTRSNAAGLQSFLIFDLYGKRGTENTAEVGCNHLAVLANSVNTAQAFSGAVGSWNFAKNCEMLFRSAVLDITLTNTSTVTCPLEVDIYRLSYSASTDSEFNSLTSMITNAESSTLTNAALTGGGAPYFDPITVFTRGMTPFELPVLLSTNKIKILQKNKYFLNNNQSCTYQIRDPKNYRLQKRSILGAGADGDITGGPMVAGGLTQTILVIFKPVAGFSELSGQLSGGATMKYLYNVNAMAESYDGLAKL